MINLVSMAGRGKRFAEIGYSLPKPLIPVSGEPMLWKVIDCLPKARKWIFVVREEHIKEFHLDVIIKKKIPNALITVDKDLLGGASIFCAEHLMDPEEDVLIAGCDNGYVYNEQHFETLKKDTTNACILWTFTKDKRLTTSPKSWGYTVLERDQKTIKTMSVKVPISENPYNDHAVTATFYVSSTKLLFQAIRTMMEKQIKVNNEYYLDMLPVALQHLGKKSVIFDVDLYVGWGTPAELHEFEKLHYFSTFEKLSELGLNKQEIAAWTTYFSHEKQKH